MGFSLGIVGLPNVGKSTLFSALTKLQAPIDIYPFTTIEPYKGVVAVPDERLEKIGKLLLAKKITPATITFIDIAGLVRGAHKGEGLGNQFLAAIREVDVICELIRLFEDKKVAHVDGAIDPQRDVGAINTELILADLSSIEKNKEKWLKKTKDDEERKTKEKFFERLVRHLNNGRLARDFKTETNEEKILLASLQLLTAKPFIYAVNVGEKQLGKNLLKIHSFLRNLHPLVFLSAKLENELAALDPKTKKEMLASYQLKEPGTNQLIRTGYKILNLVTFFTTKGEETKAWSVKAGTTAYEAAGKVHSEMQEGFIKAEVISWQKLIKASSYQEAKKRGWVMIEGKDYAIQDGDVMLFKFRC